MKKMQGTCIEEFCISSKINMIIVKGDNFKKLHFAKGENNSIFIRYHLLPIYIVQGECLMTKVNTKEGTIPTI